MLHVHVVLKNRNPLNTNKIFPFYFVSADRCTHSFFQSLKISTCIPRYILEGCKMSMFALNFVLLLIILNVKKIIIMLQI